MKPVLLLSLACLLGSFPSCSQSANQNKKVKEIAVGGSCEGCEAIHECPVPFDSLSHQCWLPDWNEKGPRLAVSGVVYNADGTPAPGIILYFYHTDQTGVYPKKGNESGWAKRHGYIRGWMKTNEKGEYSFFTLRPAAYPGRRDPAHIHITIKEPGKTEYWIDEYVFDDDPLLTEEFRQKMQNRCGSGILKLKDTGNMLKAERNIYLGKNIPGYPKQ